MWNIILCFLSCISVTIFWKRRRFYLLMLKIRGPLGYPIIGMAHKFIKRENILKIFEENIVKYGTIFFSWLGPIPFLVVSEPQIAQDILTSIHCDKGIVYDALDDGTGKGLFSLKYEKWHTHRKLLNPAFGNKILLSFLPTFNMAAERLLEVLSCSSGDIEYDLMKILQYFTLTIATETTMGKPFDKEKYEKNMYLLESYQCVVDNMAEMCFSPWLKFKFIRCLLGKEAEYKKAKSDIRKFIRKLLKAQRVKNIDSNNKVFINLALDLQRQGKLTFQNVEDECNVIVFGAFETTANTIFYTLLMLAMFPEYQEQAYEELLTIYPDNNNFEVRYEDIEQMAYMDMVIKETMRLIAPVPMISRETKQDVILSNGLILPKGIQIVIDIFHMQRRKDLWGNDADTFNPEHFLPNNLMDKHAYAFIPFTKGIRNCIGWRYGMLSMKVLLAKILRNYRIETNFKFEQLYFVEDITIKLKQFPLIKFSKRI